VQILKIRETHVNLRKILFSNGLIFVFQLLAPPKVRSGARGRQFQASEPPPPVTAAVDFPPEQEEKAEPLS
jgi:hypothetical protein